MTDFAKHFSISGGISMAGFVLLAVGDVKNSLALWLAGSVLLLGSNLYFFVKLKS